ncbi:murein DD-endopeptidase MepM/ murein hydrolase activator NlpD [Novosphingobium sp. PhB55]|uniref:M23 family metallopeptidase n=1 Tax=Novosphingobium sp. PhB55 TaxID=2485106 RepID=UPI00106473E4|nr:M23 family metallopeptidase [Novosphingobium sp. PhB55]TDW63946.1 murein DD-endopeptidase MepM/ murein hydrolase activator NlpD [Novosphingobium sp. PhB55]
MKSTSAGTLKRRLKAAFPDRELIVRSQGQVRFIRISSGMQKAAAGVAVSLLGAWCVSMGALAFSQFSATSESAALATREARVAAAASNVEKYRDNLDGTVADLARRQQFIEKMIDAHIGELPEEAPAEDAAKADPAQADPAKAGEPARKISAVLPEAGKLAQLEAGQIALVERLTRYADHRAALASDTIRKLGLNPAPIMARARSKVAEGGPLESLATAADGSLDPRFQRLGLSLARMDALENGLASIPQVQPAHVAYVSSSYGYRSDPFTGGAAFHAGLDFPGPMGSPIYAAAKGKVSFVGQRQGYGNCIEISHGNGLMTRYGHLSAFGVRVGQEVDGGTRIAAMGSTGRSTGSHLHFEVRVNNRPMNPRPFLEAARNVQQEAR